MVATRSTARSLSARGVWVYHVTLRPNCGAAIAARRQQLREQAVRGLIRLSWLWLGLSLAMLGCGADEEAPPGDSGDAGPELPEPICFEPGDGPYPLGFADVTAEIGLASLGMTGSNVTVADIDGDRWPDLMLTKGRSAREDPGVPAGLYHLYRNEAGSGFSDVTWSSGLFTARDGTPGRATTYAVFADVDNDGDADAFSVVYEDSGSEDLLDHTALLFNDGSGHFTIGPAQSFSAGSRDPLASTAVLDYDRDGLLDLFVGHHYGTYGSLSSTIQDSLFRGDGFGGFVDVTTQVGLETLPFSSERAAQGISHKPTWGVSACDLDGDGWTDLMASSYGRQFNALYRNASGQFEDLTLSSGFGSDGNEDYGDNQFYRCFCQAHPSEAVCEGASSPQINCSGLENAWNVGFDDQPWRLGGNSSNAVCGDIDGDGDMDVLAVELAHWHIGQSSDLTELLINDGFPAQPLSRPGNEATGLERDRVTSWNDGDLGGALCDFDNDGRLDVLVASSDYPHTSSLLWQQQADGSFVEIGEGAGARIDRAHGIGVVDYDRDGDYDLVLGTSLMRWSASDNPPAPDDAYAYLLRNDTGHGVNRLMLHLEGAGAPDGSSREAVGARITATAGGRTFVREVVGGHGLTGFQHDRLLIIGIGPSCGADEITIRWPNPTGDEQTLTDVLANYVLVVDEGVGWSYQSLAEYTAQQPRSAGPS